MSLTLDRNAIANARVAVPGNCAAPIAHAARELARYLAALVSAPVPDIAVDNRLPETVILLGTERAAAFMADSAARPLAEDGYAIVVEHQSVAIGGVNARGTLFGVYSLLHTLGCRWLTPDDDDEYVPTLDEIRLAHGTRTSAPDFRRRGFGEDTRAVPAGDGAWFADLVADTRRLADWMAKNRLNHLTTRADALAEVADLRDDLDRRGIASYYGTGHTIPRLLPRELFVTHPDYFRMDATGQRRPDGNLCVSNPAAMAIVVANAVDEVRRGQPVEIYNLQGEDTPKGSWCACPDCRELSSLQQNLRVCRAVEAGLQDANLGRTRVALAAYQATIDPALSLAELPDGLFVHFAPPERSYGAALDAATPGTNSRLARHLHDWAALLGADGLGVIEYYTDAVRFASLPVPLSLVIAADLRTYRAAGATAWMRVLFMSRYCWWAYPLNAWVVSRLAWDVDEPLDAIVADFCRCRYGPVAEAMVAFFAAFESAMALVVGDGEIDDLPSGSDPDVQRRLQIIERAGKQLSGVIAAGEVALARCQDAPHSRRVRRDLLAARFAANQVSALGHHLRGKALSMRGEDPDRTASELEQAITGYRQGVELLASDPEAPRSAWLDSGLGLQQQIETIVLEIERMLADLSAR